MLSLIKIKSFINEMADIKLLYQLIREDKY